MEWSDILESIIENKSWRWIFSGIGVFIIGGIVTVAVRFFSGKGNSTITKTHNKASAGDNSELDQSSFGNVKGDVIVDKRKGATTEETVELVERILNVAKVDEPQVPLTELKAAYQQIGQLEGEKATLKEQLTAAIQRAEQAEDQGEPEAKDALESLRETGDSARLLEYLVKLRDAGQANLLELNREIAAIGHITDNIETEEEALKQVLKIYPDDLYALNGVGYIYFRRGMLQEAIEVHEHVLNVARKNNEEPWQVAAGSNLGTIYAIQGDLDKAEVMFRRSLEFFNRFGCKGAVAGAYGNLGLVCQKRGDLAKAEKMLLKALDIFEYLREDVSIARNCGNLGLIYQELGDLDKAEEMYLKAMKIEEHFGRVEGMVIGYGNLGLIYQERRELDKAEQMHRKALEINKRLGRQEGMAIQYGNLGLVYMDRDQFDKAKEMYRKSLEIFDRLGQQKGVAANYANLGSVYNQRGEIDAAREFWTKARDIYAKIGIRHMADKVQGWLDELDKKQGDGG